METYGDEERDPSNNLHTSFEKTKTECDDSEKSGTTIKMKRNEGNQKCKK